MANATLYTIEIWMHLGDCLALKKLGSPSAIAPGDSYASVVLSNLPHASIFSVNSEGYAIALTIC